MNPKEKLIVALDVDSFERAESLVDMLSDDVDIFKVGIAPFTGFGQALLNKLETAGKKVFLDLKIHDIPNTVRNVVRCAVKKGVFMMNFHCLGGLKMLETAAREAKIVQEELEGEKTILLGVTILTSMGEKDIQEIGLSGSVMDKVFELAALAERAGLDGVVASSQEAKMIKETMGRDFVVVTPGIRPEWAVSGDQKRILTPKQALREGADYLVVGRPIIQADDPVEAVGKILEEMNSLTVDR
ncbi:MAG: orotidine-5'-phosphate decarboxylase [Candidatus Omnitrophota bacterium]